MNQTKITEDALRKLLTEGVVKIVFEKKDKTHRTLEATLQADLLPVVDPDKPKRERKPSTGLLTVFVPELKSWRSFHMDQLLEQPTLL